MSLWGEKVKSTIHYARVVTVVTAVALLAAAGVRTAPPVLILPLQSEFGWARAEISLAIALSILWFGLGGPLGGLFVDLPRPKTSSLERSKCHASR